MAKFTFDYLSAANVMAQKGDYEAALHYYFLERNVNPGEDIDVFIADTYSAMGIYNEALRFYFRAHAQNQYNEDAIRGIILCLKDFDEDAAFYYLNCVLGDASEDVGVEFDDCDEPPVFTLHDRRDKSQIMDKAYRLLESGNADGANEIFESISKDAYQYCDSVLARATLKMDKMQVDEAMKLADEALDVDPDHLGTHILKIMAYDTLGDRNKVAEWIDRLDKLDVCDEEDVLKVALCLCNYEFYGKAEKYINRKLQFMPYDKLMLMCLCALKMAQGDSQSAFKVANKVNTVYCEDVEVKEITSRILSGKGVKMPKELFELKREWAEKIKNLFMENGGFTLPEHIMWIKWLLKCDDYLYLQSAVCAYVTCLPEYKNIVDDILIDPFAPPIVKKQILMRRVCDESTTQINFVISNVFRSLKVTHPKVADNLKYAYYYVFVALSVMELSFEQGLERAFGVLRARYAACEDVQKEQLSINVLASLLFFMAQKGGKISKDFEGEHLELFDCERQEFERAGKMLGLLKGD